MIQHHASKLILCSLVASGPAALAAEPVELVAGKAGISANSPCLDETNVYFRRHGHIVSVPKAGGAFTQIVKTPPKGQSRLLHHSGSLYYTEGKDLVRVTLRDQQRTVLGTDDQAPESLTTDGTNLYWISKRRIRRMPITGGIISDVATGLNDPFDLSADPGSSCCLWFGVPSGTQGSWTAGTTIMRIRKSDNNGKPIYHASTSASMIRGDEDTIYFRQRTSGRVEAVSKSSANGFRFILSTDGPDLVSEGTQVYSFGNGYIKYGPKKGGFDDFYLARSVRPTGLAVDKKNVYFTTVDGGLFKIQR